jgi:CRISPR-associated endonuclease/helicase Cas3
MGLYQYQERVKKLIQDGYSVILQAPTGAGKTRAALSPFIEAFFERSAEEFPRQCIYSVPVRTLANQFEYEYREYTNSYERRHNRSLKVTIQTGAHPDDPELKGDLIFTTIDQTLSNLLGVPYAVGRGRANLNVGAVISSYLVFDEFHLYPHGDKSSIGALITTLEVLRLLQGITPFILMTATFSSTMLDELKTKLGAEVVSVPIEELMDIPSQKNKLRCYHVVRDILTARAVLEKHQFRSIVICNTVDRAQALFEELRQARGQDIEVVLLHSRFTGSDRSQKESLICKELGKDKGNWTKKSLILVATQVIEVGMDITCENLHTEIAPANAIFQRAGRCARFKNEQGNVYIYDVPSKKNGDRNFMPYLGVETKLSETTWQAFSARDDAVLDFYGEQEVIDEVHTEADHALLRSMRENEGEIWNLIRRAIFQNDSTTRRVLIRDSSDSRILLVHDNPVKLENPFRYRGFSFFIGSLLGKYNEMEQWTQEGKVEWLFKFPQEAESVGEEDSRSKVEYLWHNVRSEDDLKFSQLLVVNPNVVEYDKEIGFRFGLNGNIDPKTLNDPVQFSQKGMYGYQLEDYFQHIQKMTHAFELRWRDRLIYAAKRLEQKQNWPIGSIERAVRLAIALHDVGKMEIRWQNWARKYQEKIGEEIKDPTMMIVHTHSETTEHRCIAKEIHLQRPKHAGEGAIAVAKLVNHLFNPWPGLQKATLSAIARHHSAQTDSFNEKFQLEKNAHQTILTALHFAGFEIDFEITQEVLLKAPITSLERQILSGSDDNEWWLAYFLIVHALRQSDGESQEER